MEGDKQGVLCVEIPLLCALFSQKSTLFPFTHTQAQWGGSCLAADRKATMVGVCPVCDTDPHDWGHKHNTGISVFLSAPRQHSMRLTWLKNL